MSTAYLLRNRICGVCSGRTWQNWRSTNCWVIASWTRQPTRQPSAADSNGSDWCQIAGDVVMQLCRRLNLRYRPRTIWLPPWDFRRRCRYSSLPARYRVPCRHSGSSWPLYVVVEKILGPDEPLPESWPVAGTTGYDFLNRLSGLLVYPNGLADLRKYYDRILDERIRFDNVRLNCKYMILRVAMSSELQMLAERLNHISEQHRRTSDFTLNMLRHVLREVLGELSGLSYLFRTPRGVRTRPAIRESGDRHCQATQSGHRQCLVRISARSAAAGTSSVSDGRADQ